MTAKLYDIAVLVSDGKTIAPSIRDAAGAGVDWPRYSDEAVYTIQRDQALADGYDPFTHYWNGSAVVPLTAAADDSKADENEVRAVLEQVLDAELDIIRPAVLALLVRPSETEQAWLDCRMSAIWNILKGHGGTTYTKAQMLFALGSLVRGPLDIPANDRKARVGKLVEHLKTFGAAPTGARLFTNSALTEYTNHDASTQFGAHNSNRVNFDPSEYEINIG